MKYRTIPGTDLSSSVIGLGAFPFGFAVDEETSFALMDRFFEAGGTLIDTALVYGEWLPDGKGRSEKTVGKWVKARGIRQEVIVGTKGAHPRMDTMDRQRLSRDDIAGDLDESLRNLQTDVIDLYWLHRDDPARPVAEILSTLNDQVAAGKIRYFGCSNWKVGRIREAQAYAAEHRVHGFVANQLMWSLAVPNREAFFDPVMVVMDDAMKPFHLETGMAAMAYSSQAHGFFARLQRSPMDELPDSLRATYDNAENIGRASRLTKLAAELSLSVSALALAYLIAQPFPTYPLSGCSTMEQLVENLEAGDVELDPSQVAYLESGA